MAESSSLAVQIVPISQVSVVNPRIRNKKSFRELVENIAALGLKKPITVTKREEHQGVRYDLVCGQGRLEAFMELGASEIPALVIEASVEDCMVKSLVENCARRQHHAIDLLHDIGGMKQRGYTDAEIAKKTGLSLEYVRGVGRLLAQGEQRLLRAVEAGHIPVSVAVQIADADDIGIQEALHQAIDLLHDIGGMKQRGYTDAEIAKKTGLSLEYVRGVGRLLAQGEQRLLRAVEAGHIPVSVAVQIADADDIGIQEALHQAYERNLLRGRKLMIVKRIVESRRRRGRAIRGSGPKEMSQRLSSRTLLRAYKEDTDRKRLLIRKADATRNRLLFIAHAMRELFGDERFVSLLKAEKLDSVPKKLLGRMERGDVG